MTIPARSPRYLVRTPHSYCFRIRIPKDLQELVRKKEWRYSLKTDSQREAKVKAELLAWHAHLIFRELRSTKVEELSSEQIQALVKVYFKRALEMLEERFLIDDSPFLTRREFYSYVDSLDDIKDDLVVQLGTSNYDHVEDIVHKLLEDNGITGIKKGSYSYRQLCRGILKAQMKEVEIEKKQMLGDYPSTQDTVVIEQPIQNMIPGQQKGDPVSEVIQKYAAEAKINWNDKTKREALSSLNLLVEFVDDISIQNIDRRQVAQFKDALKKLPPNRNKDPRYRGKSISQLLKMEVPKTLSNQTVRKHLSWVRTLFDYACKHGIYIGPNPATDMQPPKKRRAGEHRAPFTDKELNQLFGSEEYLKDTHKHPYQFWTPVIALFTGARQTEIAQLYLSDIRRTDDGVLVFDINDDEDKKLKADSSKRIVPIHPFLLDDLNLVSYVNHLKEKGDQRLFPELKKGRDGYGRRVSYWFNQIYKKRCGIVANDGRMKDFHSFRKTFITHLVHKKVNERMRLQVVGHAQAQDMTVVYADPFPAKQLLEEVILKLDYGIDLSHLKKSRYVAY